jgi:hypothetical protein
MSNTPGPLMLFNPMSLLLFLSFYSPIILATSILSVSFFHENFKGIIFLAFLLSACLIRYFFYMYRSPTNVNTSNNALCNAVEFSRYGNSTFTMFVFGFIIAYLFIPMFINNSINFVLVVGLFIYFSFDMFIKITNGCVLSRTEIFVNFLSGLVAAGVMVGCMYAGGSGKFMFFNEVQSNKDVCNMPSKQTFKCQVYKNGELIGNV